MQRRLLRLAWTVSLVLSLLAMACTGGGDAGPSGDAPPAEGAAQGGGPVTVTWFVGLGTGAEPEQVAAQEAIVEAFNASHDEIQLEIEIVANKIAAETLRQRIADGDAPDIIGPVGVQGGVAFQDQFLDLRPHIERTDFDLSVYEAEQVEFWREPDGRLTALPFGVFPSFIFYNRELFDRAGLPYPPHTFDGTVGGDAWTTEKLYEMAQVLTLDANGNNALSPDFDPEHILQWGFHHQYGGDARAQGALFGAGSLVAPDGRAQIPDVWLDEWRWYHDLVWEAHGAPNKREFDSALLNQGNTFFGGNVAMVFTHLWYTGSLKDASGQARDFFDIAVTPSHNGVATSKLHADTFRILASTEHPDEAFAVLSYLMADAAPELLEVYGSLPANVTLREPFFERLDETFPQGVDWEVVERSLARPDYPSHEAGMPNFFEAEARIDEFEVMLADDPGMDVVAEAERLRADLDTIFSAPPAALAGAQSAR